MDFIKDNDEVTIDPSAIRLKSHADVTTDRDRIVTTIDSSNITIAQREVVNDIDPNIIDVSAAHFHIGLDGIDVSGDEIDQYTKITGGNVEFAKNAKISTNNVDVCLNTLDISFTSQDYLDKIGVTRQEIGSTGYYRLDNFLQINKGIYRFQDHREGYIDDTGPIVYDDNKLILVSQSSGAFLFIFIEFRLTEGSSDETSTQDDSVGNKTFTPYWNKDTTTGLYWRHYDSRYIGHSPISKSELETLLAGSSWDWDTLLNDGSWDGYLRTGQIPFTILKNTDTLTIHSNKVEIQGNYLDFARNGEIYTHNHLHTLSIDFTDPNYLDALGIKRKQIGTTTQYELLNFLSVKGLSGFIGVYVYDANKLIITKYTNNGDLIFIWVEFRLTNGTNDYPQPNGKSVYVREWTHDLTSGFWWRHYDSRWKYDGNNATKADFEGGTYLLKVGGWDWFNDTSQTSGNGYLTLYDVAGSAPTFTILKSINSKLSLNNDNIIVNGAMGIGTNIPTAPLTIYNNPSNVYGSETLRLVGSWNSSSNRGTNYPKDGALLKFTSIIDQRANNDLNNEYTQAGISAMDGGSWGGALLFHTASNGNDGGGTLSEKMRITADGNVGIGTGSPNYKLSLGESEGSSFALFEQVSDGNYFYGMNTNNHRLNFFASSGNDNDSNVRMCIERDSGRVGIRTTQPTATLHINGATRADGELYCDYWLRSNSSGYGWYHHVHGGGWYMSDNNWIRSYGSKNIYCDAEIRGKNIRAEDNAYIQDHLSVGFSTSGNHGYALDCADDSRVRGNFAIDGWCNVGWSSTVCPLYVHGSTTGVGGSGNWTWFGNSGLTEVFGTDVFNSVGSDTVDDESITIYATHSILAGNYVGASDKRIKNDISNVDTADSLSIVNNIECKNYNYIDIERKSNTGGKVTGFIAQQVREVYPKAVSIIKDYTPDTLKIIYPEWSKTTDISGDVKYSFTIEDLELTSNNTGMCRFFVTNDLSSNEQIEKEVKVEPDNKTFVFDESWNNVFFYGKQVDDFHVVDKNKIFQLHHPAIQELSRLNDEKTAQIAALQQDNADLRAQLQQIKTHLGLS